MPRTKKENLVHFDIESLSQKTEKELLQPTSLGQTLQARREKKKLSLEDVAKKLCIKEVYLRALEEGHYYAFPNRVYGIGFLRSYAKFLGLDSDLMVAEFHAETSDIKDAPLDMPVIEKHLALPSKKTLGLLSLLILIVIIGWFTVALFLSTDLFDKIQLPSFSNNTEESSETVVVNEEAPLIADEALALEQTSESTETLKVEEKLPQKEVEKETEKTLNQAVFTAPVAFVAKGNVWVRLYNTETGRVILDKTLSKNDSFMPESSLTVLQISTGRGRMLDLYQNGKKVTTFGHEKSRSLAEFAVSEN